MDLLESCSHRTDEELIAQARVIAKGERIRDFAKTRLFPYGSRRSKWTKKNSPVFEREGTFL
ncbi:MAG: hypothetical protein R3F37_16210 [Candidatus Competibacteraceae bacterium]